MNTIYALGSIFSNHPVILKKGRIVMANMFAENAAKQLQALYSENLEGTDVEDFIIASTLLSVFEAGMKLDSKAPILAG